MVGPKPSKLMPTSISPPALFPRIFSLGFSKNWVAKINDVPAATQKSITTSLYPNYDCLRYLSPHAMIVILYNGGRATNWLGLYNRTFNMGCWITAWTLFMKFKIINQMYKYIWGLRFINQMYQYIWIWCIFHLNLTMEDHMVLKTFGRTNSFGRDCGEAELKVEN